MKKMKITKIIKMERKNDDEVAHDGEEDKD